MLLSQLVCKLCFLIFRVARRALATGPVPKCDRDVAHFHADVSMCVIGVVLRNWGPTCLAHWAFSQALRVLRKNDFNRILWTSSRRYKFHSVFSV